MPVEKNGRLYILSGSLKEGTLYRKVILSNVKK